MMAGINTRVVRRSHSILGNVVVVVVGVGGGGMMANCGCW